MLSRTRCMAREEWYRFVPPCRLLGLFVFYPIHLHKCRHGADRMRGRIGPMGGSMGVLRLSGRELGLE